MSIQKFLRTDFPIIQLSAPVDVLLEVLGSHPFSHVPIFEGERFLGMLPVNNDFSITENQTIDYFLYEIDYFFVQENSPWQDVMEFFAKYDTNIIPVLNEKTEYLGYYHLDDFIHLFSEMPFFKERGNFIVLETQQESYSFSEIAQIAESNHSKILGMLISKVSNDTVQITLKIISNSLSEVLQTFRRYGYAVVLEKEDDWYLQELKEKTDYFEKYLNV